MHWTEYVAVVIIVLAVVPVLIAVLKLLLQKREGPVVFEQRTVPGFGEFEVRPEFGEWIGSWQHSQFGELTIEFESKEDAVPDSQIQMARAVLERLPELVEKALEYYGSQPDAISLAAEQFDGIVVMDDEANPFSLMFEVGDEHDTFVTVDFQDFQPIAYDCGD